MYFKRAMRKNLTEKKLISYLKKQCIRDDIDIGQQE